MLTVIMGIIFVVSILSITRDGIKKKIVYLISNNVRNYTISSL